MQELTLTKITPEELQDLIETSVNRVLTFNFQGNKTESDQWFSLDELRNYLPDKPARQTVYGWVHHRLIPYRKGKKRLRFLKSEVDQWLLNEEWKTRSEVKESILVTPKRNRASKKTLSR